MTESTLLQDIERELAYPSDGRTIAAVAERIVELVHARQEG